MSIAEVDILVSMIELILIAVMIVCYINLKSVRKATTVRLVLVSCLTITNMIQIPLSLMQDEIVIFEIILVIIWGLQAVALVKELDL